VNGHPLARSFDDAVDAYEEARPDYPAEAVAWIAVRLGLTPERTVLDLGAGTGKLTRRLTETGAHVVALEPLPGMRAKLQELLPAVPVLSGSAEGIPLPDLSVDAVTAGQAFHWFRLDDALPEIARVLRPGGGLALIWNRRAPGPVASAFADVLRPLRGETPSHADSPWREQLERSGLFTPVEERTFEWEEQVDEELLAKRLRSISFVAALPEEQQEEAAEELRERLAGLPRPLSLPYATVAFVCYRR
jgi:SAM-dependent methyltransferase